MPPLTTDSLWIILTGALVAGACGLLGCFLVLRRLSMLGDAISHAVLPGIVLAFILTNSRASLPIFIGAALMGILATFLVQSLSRGGVQADAAMGVTFTSLFALGVVLVTAFTRNSDLDVDCVLYGDLEMTLFDRVLLGGFDWGPRAVWVNAGLLALNLLVIGLLYKELKICAFDPGMAAAVGLPVMGLHYLLMGLVSVTTVGAFESVGAILVVAMLIVPGATAYLLTDRLDRMLGLSVLVGVLASIGGYVLSRLLDCSIAGAMAVAAGALFALAFLFSPTHGVVSRIIAQRRIRRRVADEDVLLWAARRTETEGAPGFTSRDLSRGLEWLPAEAASTARRLVSAGMLDAREDSHTLTPTGLSRATELLRRHRLYESYLGDLGYPADHLHEAADRVEHHLSPTLTAAMDAATQYPERDPQGKRIPPPENER